MKEYAFCRAYIEFGMSYINTYHSINIAHYLFLKILIGVFYNHENGQRAYLKGPLWELYTTKEIYLTRWFENLGCMTEKV